MGTHTSELAKYGLLDDDREPLNLDEFEPHGDPESDELGSYEWHDATSANPYEGVIVCGTCHPELLDIDIARRLLTEDTP